MTDEGWIKAEREHEREMAEAKFREARFRRAAMTTRIGYVSTAVAAIGVVAILALLAYTWQKSTGERGQELEQACIEAGGTWTQIGGSTGKVCVHIDKVEQ